MVVFSLALEAVGDSAVIEAIVGAWVERVVEGANGALVGSTALRAMLDFGAIRIAVPGCLVEGVPLEAIFAF